MVDGLGVLAPQWMMLSFQIWALGKGQITTIRDSSRRRRLAGVTLDWPTAP